MAYFPPMQLPADIPPPGVEAFGVTTIDGGGGHENSGYTLVSDQRKPTGIVAEPGKVELRTQGVEDRMPMAPAWAYFLRDDNGDATWWRSNDGIHVVQTPGADLAHGSMGPEAPIYGSTWRLDPVPADTGVYISG